MMFSTAEHYLIAAAMPLIFSVYVEYALFFLILYYLIIN